MEEEIINLGPKWKLSKWTATEDGWTKQPTLTIEGQSMQFDTPQQYIDALKELRKSIDGEVDPEGRGKLNDFMQEFITFNQKLPGGVFKVQPTSTNIGTEGKPIMDVKSYQDMLSKVGNFTFSDNNGLLDAKKKQEFQIATISIQKAFGLPQTGNADAATLNKLHGLAGTGYKIDTGGRLYVENKNAPSGKVYLNTKETAGINQMISGDNFGTATIGSESADFSPPVVTQSVSANPKESVSNALSGYKPPTASPPPMTQSNPSNPSNPPSTMPNVQAPINRNSTKDQIKAYQRANGLTVSGTFSPQTTSHMNSRYPGWDTPAAPAPAPTPKPPVVTPTPQPVPQPPANNPPNVMTPSNPPSTNTGSNTNLRLNSSGAAVTTLQTFLKKMGYDVGTIDGKFGPKTDAALRQFQQSQGLFVDGIAGTNTFAAIDRINNTPQVGAGTTVQNPGVTNTPVNNQPPSTAPVNQPGGVTSQTTPGQGGIPQIVPGTAQSSNISWSGNLSERADSRGDSVRQLQQFLKDAGYDVGTVDGIFGPKTSRAVMVFQSDSGITNDGVAGTGTMQAINQAISSGKITNAATGTSKPISGIVNVGGTNVGVNIPGGQTVVTNPGNGEVPKGTTVDSTGAVVPTDTTSTNTQPTSPVTNPAADTAGTTTPGPAAPAGPSTNPNLYSSIIGTSPLLQQYLADPSIKSAFDSWDPLYQSNYIQSILGLEKAIAAGKVINPDLKITETQAKQFYDQAVTEMDPYYQEQFGMIRSNLEESLKRTTSEFQKNVDRQNDSLRYGFKDLSNTYGDQLAGTAFSSDRGEQERRLFASSDQSLQDLTDQAGRSINDNLRGYESKFGTQGAGGINAPSLGTYSSGAGGLTKTGTRQLYTPYGNIKVGSENRQRELALVGRQKELEGEEINRRITNSRTLS